MNVNELERAYLFDCFTSRGDVGGRAVVRDGAPRLRGRDVNSWRS